MKSGEPSTYLLVEIKMRQRQLDSLAYLLLLHIQPTNVSVCDIRLLIGTEHGYGRVCLGW